MASKILKNVYGYGGVGWGDIFPLTVSMDVVVKYIFVPSNPKFKGQD